MTKRLALNLAYWLVVAAAVFGVVASAVDRPEHVIRIALLGSVEDEDYDGALVFKDYVESRTNGAVRVEVFASGQFCSAERECIEALQAGVLDVFMTTIGGLGAVYGPGQVFDLPYAFRDDQVAECVFDGPLMDELRRAVLADGVGMRLMTATNTGGWRHFATTSRPVRSPADLPGVKIRTTPAPLQQELVRQLGGAPTPIAWSEVYTALATGVVEGTKNSVQDLVAMNLHEHVKFITLDGHAYMGALWWYSDRRWRELPGDVRRVVFDGFARLKAVTRALPVRRQIDAYAAFAEAGGVVHAPTPDEKAAFRDAVGGMRAWYADRYGAAWLDRLDAAVADCERRADEAFRRSDASAP